MTIENEKVDQSEEGLSPEIMAYIEIVISIFEESQEKDNIEE